MSKTAAVKKAQKAELAPNAFIGKPAPPNDKELSVALGTTMPFWAQLIEELRSARLVDGQEWHSYSKKAGWSLKLMRGERVILYLSPLTGSLRASFALGEKALAAARASRLPEPVLKILGEAKKYAEGTAVRIEVSSVADLDSVMRLAKAKVDN